jgi:hypothetical protein
MPVRVIHKSDGGSLSVCISLISRFPEPLNHFDRIFADTLTRQQKTAIARLASSMAYNLKRVLNLVSFENLMQGVEVKVPQRA